MKVFLLYIVLSNIVATLVVLRKIRTNKAEQQRLKEIAQDSSVSEETARVTTLILTALLGFVLLPISLIKDIIKGE